MKKTVAISVIVTLVMVSSAFAGDILGRHNLSNDQGLVTVKSIEGQKMAFDVIYTPRKGRLIILTDVFADYDSRTQRAIYSDSSSTVAKK
jgi:hypothetical protein